MVPKKPKRKPKKRKKKYWTTEEFQLFFYHAERDLDLKWFAFFRLLAYTGMRKGEVLALHWSDIDFEKAQVDIYRTMSPTKEDSKHIDSTKTEESDRTIPIDSGTLEILKKWRAKQGKVTGIVFTNSNDDYYIHTHPLKKLYSVIDRHNLSKVDIHAFRHTHCSLLAEAGVSPREAMERLGHKDIGTTMNIYTHVSKNKKIETIDKFVKYVSR